MPGTSLSQDERGIPGAAPLGTDAFSVDADFVAFFEAAHETPDDAPSGEAASEEEGCCSGINVGVHKLGSLVLVFCTL